jgi:tetratricopeptide (TPR) repeat protein
LNNLGAIAKDQGEYTQARGCYEESLAIDRILGDRSGIARGLGNLGGVAHQEGDYARARSLYRECLAIKRDVGERRGIAIALNNLAETLRRDGDADGAHPLFVESLEAFQQSGDRVGIANVLEGLAMVAAARSEMSRVARLMGAADALRTAIGMPLPPSGREEYARMLEATRAALGAKVFEAAWTEGQAMTQDQAVICALTEARDG